VTAELKANAAKLPAGLMFTGNPSELFPLPTPPPTGDEEPVEDGDGPKITEEQRLAVVIEMIEAETALAPVGALSVRSAGAVSPSPAFAGLDASAAKSISSYVLLNKAKPASVLTPAVAKSADALASAETIVPKAALCVFTDESVGAVTVRNLLWPGAVAFCKPGTKTWGYCYFGTGEKNLDIAFMLP